MLIRTTSVPVSQDYSQSIDKNSKLPSHYFQINITCCFLLIILFSKLGSSVNQSESIYEEIDKILLQLSDKELLELCQLSELLKSLPLMKVLMEKKRESDWNEKTAVSDALIVAMLRIQPPTMAGSFEEFYDGPLPRVENGKIYAQIPDPRYETAYYMIYCIIIIDFSGSFLVWLYFKIIYLAYGITR